VTDGAALDWAATWLPDDSALVYSSNRFETNKLIGDLFILRLDGSAPPSLVVGLPNFDEDMAAVSGDGRIAFSTDGGGTTRSIDLLDRVGSSPRQLTDGLWVDSDPVWWPDRDTILFTRSSASDPATGDLWTVRASDTHALIQLTNDPAAQSHPAVSPNGSGYAFQEDVGGSSHIMLVEGSGPARNLTSGLGGNSYEPTW
jgi:Tol biopolymer transport system component